MIFKGYVSTIDNTAHRARIILKDMEDFVTPELPLAFHIGSLEVNDMVAVVFFSKSMTDGLIVAKF
jgi:phosphotransferase system IIB component